MVIYTRPFALNVLTLALFPLYTFAASPWTVNDGSTLQVTSGYSSTESNDFPLYASGLNSLLTTDSNLRFSTMTTGTYAAYVADQATLELNNASLSTMGSVASGIYADNATLKMTGGVITTVASQAHGISASNSSLTLSDVNILPGGANAYGIKMAGGTLTADRVNISSSAAIGGMTLSGGASATLNDVGITLLSSGGDSAISLTNSSLVGNNVTITSNVYTSQGGVATIQVGTNSSLELTDSTINSASGGVRGWTDSNTTLTNVNITTTGGVSHAVDANKDNAQITIRGGTYLTKGISAYGAWLAGTGSLLDAQGATFQTEGSSAHAVVAQKGSAVIKDSTLTTTGAGSYGFYTETASEGSQLNITTSGKNAYGTMVVNQNNQQGSKLTLTDSGITTSGDGAYGIAATAGGVMILTDSEVNTSGNSASGAVAFKTGSVTLQGSTLTTTGDSAYGLIAANSGTVINADGTTFNTSGAGSYGAVANTGSTVNLTDSTFSTSGNKSGGLYALAASTINADGIAVDTAGTESFGLATDSSTLNISNSQFTTTGVDATGLFATSAVAGTASNVTLDNVNLTSEVSSGATAKGATLNLTLKNGTVIEGGNGVALSAVSLQNQDGTTTYSDFQTTADGNVSLLGNVVTDSYDHNLTLSLANNSQLTGSTQNISQLILDATSRWLMTGNSNLQDLKQDGLVTFSSSNGGFSTLTVDGDLTGSGTFAMNTKLGDDTSPTDQVLVTGNASGSFGVTINNKGGEGAQTNAGILLVQVAGDAQSATFTQNNSVVAGNYEYFLNKVNGNAWYLQSSYTPVDPETPDNGDNSDAGGGAAVVPDDETPSDNKTWRPEVAGYLIAPYLNAAYGFTSAGTYHERLGAMQGDRAAWGRVYGRHDRYSAGRFAFDVNTAFIQLGGDTLKKDLADNWHVKAGPMLTLGRQHSSNKDNARSARPGLSVDVGKTDTTAYGIGGYLTTWNDDGSYLDTVGQLTRYSNRFTSLTRAKMDSYAVLLSAEVGKPFTLAEQIKLEPQVQLMGQYMNISQTYASGVKLKDQNVFIGQARGGLRLFYDAPMIQPYVKADVIQQLGSTPGVDMNGETLRPDVRKGVWRTGAGISGKVTSQLNLYAEATYSHSFGQGFEGYTGNLGVKYQF